MLKISWLKNFDIICSDGFVENPWHLLQTPIDNSMCIIGKNSILRSVGIIFLIIFPVIANAGVDSNLLKAAGKGDIVKVKVLLDKGANPNAREQGFLADSNNTPLMLASVNNHGEVVEELIKRGADVNATNHAGNTALMFALWKGHQEIVELLMDHGADVSLKDNAGQSPLYIAVAHGPKNIEILERLLEKGAFVDTKNQHGYTPLFMAVDKMQVDTIRLLLKHGANPNVIIPSTGKDILTIALELADAGKPEFKEIAQIIIIEKESRIKEAKENTRIRLLQAQRVEEDKRRKRVQKARAESAARLTKAKAQKAARHRELVAKYGDDIAVAIETGEVRIGMTKEVVIAVRGRPNHREEIPPSDELWFYGKHRVTFTEGKVTYVSH